MQTMSEEDGNRFSCGNKLKAVEKVLDAVRYIEENQNSPDMQLSKSMLLKIAEVMILVAKGPIDEYVSQQITANNPELLKKVEGQNCGDDCKCESPESPESNRDLPEYNIVDTIAQIKKEIGEPDE